MRVIKLDEKGREVWQYFGELIQRSETMILIEARFAREDVVTDYHTFRQGDRMLEYFYNDRWYNVFEMYDVDSDALKGWYCNITRPARFTEDTIYSEDLALDLMVYPDGRYRILDEDEFAALHLDASSQGMAESALAALLGMVDEREGVFGKI